MGCNNNIVSACFPEVNTHRCPDRYGCPPGECPDFIIRRHDTKPSLKVNVEDCDGPLDLTDLVVEFSFWARARLKTAIDTTASYVSFADNIGFDQVMVGDILIFDRPRNPEHMLVIGFDEVNYLVFVERGANGTIIGSWNKGAALRIMKEFSSPALSEIILEDIEERDGTRHRDQVAHSFLVYNWSPTDTCLPGCYWGEFKLLKLTENDTDGDNDGDDDTTITMTITPADYGCKLGTGVEWVRRFPVMGEGYLIRVEDSPSVEL